MLLCNRKVYNYDEITCDSIVWGFELGKQLLSNILNNREGLKVAVIVNDMSEVNIDAAIIEKGEAKLSKTDENWLKCQMVVSVALCAMIC